MKKLLSRIVYVLDALEAVKDMSEDEYKQYEEISKEYAEYNRGYTDAAESIYGWIKKILADVGVSDEDIVIIKKEFDDRLLRLAKENEELN